MRFDEMAAETIIEALVRLVEDERSLREEDGPFEAKWRWVAAEHMKEREERQRLEVDLQKMSESLEVEQRAVVRLERQIDRLLKAEKVADLAISIVDDSVLDIPFNGKIRDVIPAAVEEAIEAWRAARG